MVRHEIKGQRASLSVQTKHLLRFVVHEFIYGGHLMTLGAISAGLVAVLVIGEPVPWVAVVMIYLTIEPIYMFDRWQGYQSDCDENPERSQHLSTYLRWMPSLVVIYISSMLVLGMLAGHFVGLLACVTMLILGLAYGAFFKQFTRVIPLFKNIYVSVFWVCVSWFIVASTGAGMPVAGMWILSLIFLLSMQIQAFFDLKDVESDARVGLKTLPVLVGKDNALRIQTWCTPFMALPIVAGYLTSALSIRRSERVST
jgi:4-hydroxybenzoate polyprenyltransferase